MTHTSRISYVFAIAWLLLITTLLCIPGSSFPERSWFGNLRIDKWAHVFLFGVLVILWVIAMRKNYPIPAKLWQMILLTGLCVVLYGIGMELVQRFFITNRSFEWKDVLSDCAGAILGILYCRWRYIKK